MNATPERPSQSARLLLLAVSAALWLMAWPGGVPRVGARTVDCQFPPQAPPGFNTGMNPFALASADFNRDNQLDLAVANFGSDNVSILLGDGAGGLGAAANYAVGFRPAAVVAGDFNDDGWPDLAVANLGAATVSILLNGGAGRFDPSISLAVGIFPSALAVSDFNLDGRPDLAVVHRFTRETPGLDDYVSVFPGVGAGRFGPAFNFKVGPDAGKAVVGDFNRDGKPDLAVASNAAGRVALLLGNGAGGFSAAADFAVGPAPYSLTAGDFNRDGNLDLAVADYNTSEVSLLLGSGAGSFAAPVNFAVGFRPFAIAAADFNRDGRLDLVTGNAGAGALSLLLGAAQGGFGAAVSFAAGINPSAVLAGDFNRDGQLDLAFASYDAHQVILLLNRCVAANTRPVLTPVALALAQGSRLQGVTIATVSDAETPAGALLVTANAPAARTRVSRIVNTNGTITADVEVACDARAGFDEVLLVVDDGSGSANARSDEYLFVTIAANPPPMLGAYPAAALTVGADATLTPAAAPQDNGGRPDLTVAAPGFSGSLQVNPTTGAVVIGQAEPAGSFTVTVTATDNCGARASQSFPLTISRHATLTTLDTLPNPSRAGQPVFFRMSVRAVTGSGVPAGSVQLQINGVPISPWLTLVNGRASFQTKRLPAGTPRILAVYSGDNRYQPSQAVAFQFVLGQLSLLVSIVLTAGLTPLGLSIFKGNGYGAAFKRWLYRGQRPHWLAQVLNRMWALVGASGLTPDYLVALEVAGRTSGRIVSLPVVLAVVAGERYLVSMLGNDAQWVRNVRAAGGKAALRSGGREEIQLAEVPVDQRAPIIKAYLQRAPGARPHVPVHKDAPLAEFEKIAAEFPVFRVVSRKVAEDK